MQRVQKAALVDRAIGIMRDTLPGDLAVQPVAFIGAAIGIGDLALAAGLALAKAPS